MCPPVDRLLMHATHPSQRESNSHRIRCYGSRLVNNIENHNVRSVLCARAQAFVDQVCRAGPTAAGRRATFSKFIENPGIARDLYKPRVSEGTCL